MDGASKKVKKEMEVLLWRGGELFIFVRANKHGLYLIFIKCIKESLEQVWVRFLSRSRAKDVLEVVTT